jgi:hypothetical protein
LSKVSETFGAKQRKNCWRFWFYLKILINLSCHLSLEHLEQHHWISLAKNAAPGWSLAGKNTGQPVSLFDIPEPIELVIRFRNHSWWSYCRDSSFSSFVLNFVAFPRIQTLRFPRLILWTM